jgi:hypothetical protein
MASKIDTVAYLKSLPMEERPDAVERIRHGQVPPGARLVPMASVVVKSVPNPKGKSR